MLHALRNACELYMGLRYLRSCTAGYLQYMFLEYCHGYRTAYAISYLVIAYAVLASLLNATYDGGEWIPGFVIVLSI